MATAMILFLKRRSDMTEKEFYTYWAKHGLLIAPWAAKHGVLSYKQIHTPTAMREPHNARLEHPFNGQLDYDGMALFEVSSLETFSNAFRDPYYRNVIEVDENKFLDKKSVQIIGASTIGISKTFVDNNVVVG